MIVFSVEIKGMILNMELSDVVKLTMHVHVSCDNITMSKLFYHPS